MPRFTYLPGGTPSQKHTWKELEAEAEREAQQGSEQWKCYMTLEDRKVTPSRPRGLGMIAFFGQLRSSQSNLEQKAHYLVHHPLPIYGGRNGGMEERSVCWAPT